MKTRMALTLFNMTLSPAASVTTNTTTTTSNSSTSSLMTMMNLTSPPTSLPPSDAMMMTPTTMAFQQQVCDHLYQPPPIPLLPPPSTNAANVEPPKQLYKIGVLAFKGIETAEKMWTLTFGDYLTATVGPKFDPPITFEMVPVPFGLDLEPIDEFIQEGQDNYDFVFTQPSMYSCIDSEVGINTLASVISKRKVNGQVYSLEEFGGVIFTWANNNDINTIADLKDKRLGLVSISGFGSGQMQFREMIKNGLHHLQDPKQLIFMGNQNKVVNAVLKKQVDVGFVRTDQLDRFIDPETNEVLNQDLKIKIISGGYNLGNFPFESSSTLYPEWAIGSFPSRVHQDIERAVQTSLMELAKHANTAKPMLACYEARNCTALADEEESCKDECFQQVNPLGYQTCGEINADTILLADLARTSSKISGWRSPLSYMTIRNMQEDIGFISQQEGTSSFQCLRASSLEGSVVCPIDHFKKTADNMATGCEDLGLPCHDFKCLCKPCVKSYDVDVFPIEISTTTTTTISTNHQPRKGCSKFDVCGVVQQSHKVTFRAVDNRRREDASFVVLVHGDGETQQHLMTPVLDPFTAPTNAMAPFTYEFEFDALDSKVGYLIMEISVFDQSSGSTMVEQISQSPFRLSVEERNCEADTGDERRVPDVNGNCICDRTSIEVSSGCMPLSVFIPLVICPILLVTGVLLTLYIIRKRRKEDLIWKINSDELFFDSPPQELGRGRFGAVYLGRYRGTEVAVKHLVDETLPDEGYQESVAAPLSQPDGGAKLIFPAAKKDDVEQAIPTTDTQIGIKSCLYIPVNNNKTQTAMRSGKSSARGRVGFVSHMGSVWPGATQANLMKKEMRLLSKLRHPNVVTIMGATEDKRLVMEYMELGCMSDVLRSGTMVVDDVKVLGMVQDVAKGLHFLHASNPYTIHGDLKAQNVLVDTNFRAKVADFGLSKRLTTRGSSVASGTPFWMAPELLRGESSNSTESDVYSFGVLLYEAYQRQYPYQGEDPQEVLSQIVDPLVNKRPIVPKRCPMLVAEVMEACFREPEKRPSAAEIDHKLGSISKSGTRDQALLWELFPRHVAAAIRDGRTVEPETHENVSVLVSNIVGHKNLESTLSPPKHSSLLDRLYSKFENLCDLHNVFRLVTVGDGFMCATNLAEKQHEHVRSIAAFAADALKAAACTLIDEEDPSKGYVSIRIGISSGTVVSHVVGSRTPRYSIFGVPVSTATSLENLSVPGRAQCSEVSANLLKEQDPDADLFLRGKVQIDDNDVVAYWIGEPILPGSEPVVAAPESGASNQMGSLIEWNVDVLARIIREIVAARDTNLGHGQSPDFSHLASASEAGTIIDEVEEVVSLPQFDVNTVQRMKERQASVALPPSVMAQLRDFVTAIAQMYDNDVPFHNFQHASHVTLSVVRLLTRIKAVPTKQTDGLANGGSHGENEEGNNKSLHECSYGIASDPVTQLAIVFSALIHDTDHQGVPNVQLVKENQDIAVRYKGRSVAEQNSIALAWDLLMDPKYSELRKTIAQTEDEITRFRQLVINCVMATDIVDKALKQLRNNRWDTAFSGEIAEAEERAVNRKATIVIEHIIQASDIGHTMQQWHVYRKWNERFFRECYKAYKDGRAENDPSKGWYKGEIGFFDFYIIPLAKKLQQSGVFGVYGDEYVKNAEANREEWLKCGELVVAEMMEKIHSTKGPRSGSARHGSVQRSVKASGVKSSMKASVKSSIRASVKRR